ncbi:Histone-lysine N-methyltransferase SUV39H2 [Armadillidium vulgare]|nr:Histone-lysine N-methyltransferase SUV39H2 [Armadillidium vulgare]
MGCTYLFDLDYNKGDQNPYTVDAVKYGNVSHFINHSCDPNLVVFNVWVNCLDPDLPKLALFASRDIKKGEEITFDYNSGSTRQISILEKMEGMEDAIKLTPTKQRTNEDGNVIIPTMEFIRKTPKNRVLNAVIAKKFFCKYKV